MTDTISATHRYLLTHYGPLLTLKHLAEVLHSSPNGLRMAMFRKQVSFMTSLAAARRQLGRRVYFEARRVAELIDQDTGGISTMTTVLPHAAEQSKDAKLGMQTKPFLK